MARKPGKQADSDGFPADMPAPMTEPVPEPTAEDPVTAPPVPEFHDEPEAGHRNIQGILFRALVIFLLGAAAALWAAPKLAPHLPAGLAPLANWLMPGQDAALKAVAAAEAGLQARIDAIPTGPDAESVKALIRDELAAATKPLSDRLDALESASPAEADPALEARIAALESGIAGLTAELAGLQQAPAAADGTAQPADVSRLSARLDGLSARLDALAAQQTALKQELAKAQVSAGKSLTEAETNLTAARDEADRIRRKAGALAALTAAQAAFDAGQPFDAALAGLPEGTDVPAELAAASVTGVASLLSLQQQFPQTAHDAIAASIQAAAASGSLTDRTSAFLRAQVATRSLTPQPGDSTDAILSRMEDHLRAGDLAGALRESAGLDPAAGTVMADWTASAQNRLAAATALQDIRAALDGEGGNAP